MLVGYLYIFFGEKFIQAFDQFLVRMFVFFVVELLEFFIYSGY